MVSSEIQLSTPSRHREPLPPVLINQSKHTALRLNRMFEEGGALLRTFELYRHFNRTGLQQLDLLAKREFFGDHVETDNRSTQYEQELIAGTIIRSDLPRAAFPSTLVRWTFSDTAFDETFCVGLALPLPTESMRGPAWPHDAWTGGAEGYHTSNPKLFAKEYQCSADQLNVKQYARRRFKFEPKASCKYRWKIFAEARRYTCWSNDWERVAAMQGAFWNVVHKVFVAKGFPASINRIGGCRFGSAWNQVAFDRTHSRSALAIFYGNFSISGPKRQLSIQKHALRSREVALHVQQLLGLPLVELVADGRISADMPIFRGVSEVYSAPLRLVSARSTHLLSTARPTPSLGSVRPAPTHSRQLLHAHSKKHDL